MRHGLLFPDRSSPATTDVLCWSGPECIAGHRSRSVRRASQEYWPDYAIHSSIALARKKSPLDTMQVANVTSLVCESSCVVDTCRNPGRENESRRPYVPAGSAQSNEDVPVALAYGFRQQSLRRRQASPLSHRLHENLWPPPQSNDAQPPPAPSQ